MPYIYDIDTAREVVLVVGHGELTDDELLRGVEGFFSDPRYRPGFRIFSDLSRLTEVKVSARALQVLAESRRLPPHVRNAIYVPTSIAYGLTRVFQAYAEHHGNGEVAVFRERAAALAWLNAGLPPEKHVP